MQYVGTSGEYYPGRRDVFHALPEDGATVFMCPEGREQQ
jgi:hypothetical protein